MKIAVLSLAFAILSSVVAVAQNNSRIYFDGLSWSPDGKYLSFTGWGRSADDVYVIRADGSDLKKITADSRIEFGTSWTKGRIAYGSGVDGAPDRDIYSANPDGSDVRQLTKEAGLNYNPSFSSDGKRIVFVSNRLDRTISHHIYTMNADGSDVRILTKLNTEFVSNSDPQWSPDGKRIVYEVTKGDGMDQIWTMNADGSNKTLVTGGVGNNESPGWSPDGQRIVFSRGVRGTEGKYLYTVSADGSGLAQLGNIQAISARFSPDGKKIAYVSGTFRSTTVYVANVDGSGIVKLTK